MQFTSCSRILARSRFISRSLAGSIEVGGDGATTGAIGVTLVGGRTGVVALAEDVDLRGGRKGGTDVDPPAILFNGRPVPKEDNEH